MATYLYRNQAGEEREIIAPMDDPPPESVFIFSDNSWIACCTHTISGKYVSEMIGTHKDCRVWSRVYGAGLCTNVPDFACKPGKDGLPVSHASVRRKGGKPEKIGNHTVMVHDDGSMTNTKGQPIIDSNSAAQRNADRTGMELD